VADRAAAGVPPGPEGELVVLDPEAGVRERAEVAGVAVVQVGEHDVADRGRVDDDRRRVVGRDRPDVVVHRHRRVVRILRRGLVEVLGADGLAVGVADREDAAAHGAIVAAADALGLERPVVLGCSTGGEICLELALRHPDRFAAVVACQAADRVQDRQVAWAKHARVNEKLFVPEWVDGLMSPTAPAARRAEVRWAYGQSAHGATGATSSSTRASGTPATGWAASTPPAAPVHILAGEYDYSCTPELARATAERIPGARFTEMAGLGHFPMAEDPQAFLGYLRPVLAELT
jgi:pimeloyl-ACP methyl ester carboxylesterase